MKINQDAINEMNKCAMLRKEEIALIGHVTVKRGNFEVKCHNFGLGGTYEEALENLKARCSYTGDKTDIINIDIHTVEVGETFFMGTITE